MFPVATYIKRRQKLKDQIDNGIVVIFGNKECSRNYPANFYTFRQDSNFLYLFGLDFPALVGLMDIDTGEEIIYGNDFSLDDIIWMGHQSNLSEKCERIGIKTTKSLEKLYGDILNALKKKRRIHYLPPYREQRRQQIANYLNIKFNEVDINYSRELVNIIISLRSVKSPLEIEEIEKTISNVTYHMHLSAMKMAVPGNFEYTISGTIESIGLKNNCHMAFPIICTVNGEILHNNYHGNQLKQGRLLLVDAGSESLKHYATDITRTIPVGRKFSQMQREIYSIVLSAEEESIKLIKPNFTYKSIHLNAAKLIALRLKDLGLMKGDIDEAVNHGAHSLFFPHGLGHMLGLDVHDMEDLGEDNVGYDNETKRSVQFGISSLRLGRTLKEGFVLTVEPGIYFIPDLIKKWEAEKFFFDFINYNKVKSYISLGGIRIEDDILVTKDGCRVLGFPIPKTINEIESIK